MKNKNKKWNNSCSQYAFNIPLKIKEIASFLNLFIIMGMGGLGDKAEYDN